MGHSMSNQRKKSTPVESQISPKLGSYASHQTTIIFRSVVVWLHSNKWSKLWFVVVRVVWLPLSDAHAMGHGQQEASIGAEVAANIIE